MAQLPQHSGSTALTVASIAVGLATAAAAGLNAPQAVWISMLALAVLLALWALSLTNPVRHYVDIHIVQPQRGKREERQPSPTSTAVEQQSALPTPALPVELGRLHHEGKQLYEQLRHAGNTGLVARLATLGAYASDEDIPAMSRVEHWTAQVANVLAADEQLATIFFAQSPPKRALFEIETIYAANVLAARLEALQEARNSLQKR